MIKYQRKTLPNTNIGEPSDLPPELNGLAQVSLDDLSWADPALGYSGQGFFPVEVADPPPPVPEMVTQLQFRRALRHAGIYDDVMAYVAAQDAETVEALDFASMIRRDSPLLNAGANALLGSEEAGQSTLDAVFTYAATVVE